MGIPEGGWRVQVWHGPFDWIGTIDDWPKTIHASYVSDFVLDVHAALTIHWSLDYPALYDRLPITWIGADPTDRIHGRRGPGEVCSCFPGWTHDYDALGLKITAEGFRD